MEKLEIERKRMKKESQEVEAKVHNLFDKDKEGIVIVQDRLIKYVNPYAAELTGYNPDDLLETSFAHHVHLDELPKLVKYYLQRLTGDEVPIVYETKVKHKDGSYVYIEIKAGVIPYQGRLADFIVIKQIS